MRAPPALLSLAVALALATPEQGVAASGAAENPAAGRLGDLPREEGEIMTRPLAELLVGRWRKLPGAPCGARYPAELTFLQGGVYLAEAGEAQDFAIWGGGDYELDPPGHIKLQIQTDEMVAYEVSAEEDQLRFSDSDGCAFSYRRVG